VDGAVILPEERLTPKETGGFHWPVGAKTAANQSGAAKQPVMSAKGLWRTAFEDQQAVVGATIRITARLLPP